MDLRDISVVVATSPIPSHPETRIIDETLRSIRHHLPDSEIILQVDGVHPSQKKFTNRYNDYKTEMLWRCLHQYENVLPLVFKEHEHQSGMMHETLPEIRTPLILYVEGDAPLVLEKKIDWAKCIKFIEDGFAQTIRFHFENVIPKPHKHLMLGEPEDGFLKTIQWSQRPLLTTRIYFEEQMKYFPRNAKTFIEDEWHGVVLRDYDTDGLLGWYKHRLWIYHPENGIKRSYTTDGREGEKKYGEGIQKDASWPSSG